MIFERNLLRGEDVPEDVIEDCLNADLAAPPPEIVRVREVRGRLVEAVGPVR
jgi:hypothetical protein